MSWKNSKVLVTGADGFIGSHLVEELLRRGCKVRAFTYYNAFNSWGWLDTLPKDSLKKIEVFCGDIRDPNGVDKAVKGVHVVLHLAALIGIPFSYHSPDSYVDTKIKGILNVLKSALRNGVKKVVHTSTSEVYGTAQYVPMDEKHPINPQSPYAATKSAADELALSFYRSFDLPVTVLRPFNTFGPRQSARAIIPTIMSQMYLNTSSIKLGNIETMRDFSFVTDTVNAFLSVAESDKCIGEVLNAGSGREISIKDLAFLIAHLAQKSKNSVKIRYEKERMRPQKSEVDRLCCNTAKIRKLCGWRSKVNLEEGLKRTYQWFEKNRRAYKADIYNI